MKVKPFRLIVIVVNEIDGGSVTVNAGGVYWNGGGSKTSSGGVPPMWIVSSPVPPSMTVSNDALVLRTQISSGPPAPSTSTRSTFVNVTIRPAPAMYLSVTMKRSPIGVPITTTVSMPGPPLISTGPFWTYS